MHADGGIVDGGDGAVAGERDVAGAGCLDGRRRGAVEPQRACVRPGRAERDVAGGDDGARGVGADEHRGRALESHPIAGRALARDADRTGGAVNRRSLALRKQDAVIAADGLAAQRERSVHGRNQRAAGAVGDDAVIAPCIGDAVDGDRARAIRADRSRAPGRRDPAYPVGAAAGCTAGNENVAAVGRLDGRG